MARLPKLDSAVAETRLAVRRALATIAGDRGSGGAAPLVLVALSGGADSLALAAALAFEAPRGGWRAGAVIVDHALQAASGEVADRAAAQARELGLEPVIVRRVSVDSDDPVGPEAAARAARYAAIDEVRSATGATAIVTAHTRDDQAEQVLLALARGSGTRSIAGIPPRRDAILRPFLSLGRQTTERACLAQDLEPWRDPHNSDAAFGRVRVRAEILPLLERRLGPGVAAALARTAELAREDAEALDALAAAAAADLVRPDEASGSVSDPDREVRIDAVRLAAHPAALRNRVIRLVAARAFGAHLSRAHTRTVAGLVTDWRGQGPVNVPGVVVARRGSELVFRPLRD